MWSSRDAFENDFCPVKDDLLGAMYRANEHGLPQLVASVAPDVRAMLALFCYRRSHLHALALSIAASCTERDLIALRYGAGLSNRAIAPLVGLSESNVGTILHRTVQTLRSRW